MLPTYPALGSTDGAVLEVLDTGNDQFTGSNEFNGSDQFTAEIFTDLESLFYSYLAVI